MKKLVFTTMAVACFSATSFAQTADAAVKPEMIKEEKKAMKEKQEANLQEAYKAAGLTEEEIKSSDEIMAESSKKGKELKENDKLTAEEKEIAKKAINDEKNTKLKAVMGDEKYKVFATTRKKQKEAMQAAKAGQ